MFVDMPQRIILSSTHNNLMSEQPTTTPTTTNYPHLLVRATDRAFTWPEAQGPVSTVVCKGRGAAGTHASWQKGARAWMGISPAHRITNYRCLYARRPLSPTWGPSSTPSNMVAKVGRRVSLGRRRTSALAQDRPTTARGFRDSRAFPQRSGTRASIHTGRRCHLLHAHKCYDGSSGLLNRLDS